MADALKATRSLCTGSVYLSVTEGPLIGRPMVDDGAALRWLASLRCPWSLKLEMGPRVELTIDWGPGITVVERQHTDPAAAIRFAILRAFAVIGESMG